MPQAIFFDLDETLIRHSTPIMEQLQTVCHQHLGDLPEARWNVFHEYLQSNVGQLWRDIAQHQGRCEAEFTQIFRNGLSLAGCDATQAEPMIEAFLVSVVDSTGPAAGAHEVLDHLANVGIATGIITNGFGFLQKRKVKAHGLAERVRFVMTSEDAGVHKPDARIFRLATEQDGVAAADCWHVGDHRDNDVAGAVKAGLSAVLYDPDRKFAEAALQPASYQVIHQLTEIPQLIQ